MYTSLRFGLSTVLFSLSALTAAQDAGTTSENQLADESNTIAPQTAGPGIAYFRLGSYTLIALSDGTVPLDVHSLLQGTSSEHIDALLEDGFQQSPVETSINVFLIDTGEHVILIDAGAGELFAPMAGLLPRSLAAAGYQPEDVTDILMTHIHTDHSGGLTRDGKIVFANATVHVDSADADFFLDAANIGAGLEQQFHDAAVATVKPYRQTQQLRTFSGATELFPGVTAIPTPGHTPGHSFYRIESEGEVIEFWGDIVHIESVQMPEPQITITYDVDQDAARAQRLRQFDAAARERKLVAAAHINFPGIGYLRASNEAYEWVAAPMRNRE